MKETVRAAVIQDHFILHDPETVMIRGGSVIYSPMGECLAGPIYGEKGMLMADLDMGEITRGKYDFDPVGHYARPDVFTLTVDEKPKKPVVIAEDE